MGATARGKYATKLFVILQVLLSVHTDAPCSPELCHGEPLTERNETALSVRVRTHTTQFRECRFRSLGNYSSNGTTLATAEELSNSGMTFDCMRNFSTAGTPPDFNITVRLYNIRLKGWWRLELTNEEGSGYYDFSLQDVTGSRNNALEIAPGRSPGLEGPTIRWRKIPPHAEKRSSTSSNQSSNPYDEVQDGSVQLKLAPVPQRHRKRHCQAPREAPDDYLHPAAASSDLQASDASTSSDLDTNYTKCSSTPLECSQSPEEGQ
ncbi:hypothetical protein BaRGS_00040244 [Batillaria attramentaria]|uniref:Uncharacterized protein n=1 Tax=Batillaria attramentaria TaxID=370345 RepID=A0ABD0J117_9CAEN